MKLPHVKKPCRDCPFRKDSMKGWLGAERMKEILDQQSFVCHKTVDYGGADGGEKMAQRRQCAGHMILKGDGNEFVRLARMMRIKLALAGHDLIFDNETACIEHHGE